MPNTQVDELPPLPEPTEEHRAEAYALGVDARLAGLRFKPGSGTICPYTYDNFPGMSYAMFDLSKRPLLNAWFDGYLNKPLRGRHER